MALVAIERSHLCGSKPFGQAEFFPSERSANGHAIANANDHRTRAIHIIHITDGIYYIQVYRVTDGEEKCIKYGVKAIPSKMVAKGIAPSRVQS